MPNEKQDNPGPTIISRQELKALERLLHLHTLTVLERRVVTLWARDGRSWAFIAGSLKLSAGDVQALVDSAKNKARAASETGRTIAEKLTPTAPGVEPTAFPGIPQAFPNPGAALVHDPATNPPPVIPHGRGPLPVVSDDENPFAKGNR